VQVFGGTPAAPNAQYVMLQMWTAGQKFVGGHAITVYDEAGTLADTFTFGSLPLGLLNSASQDTVLIATSEAQALFNVTADLTMTPISTGPGAKFCWAGTTDCVSVGTYAGPTTGAGNPFYVSELVGLAFTRRLDVAGTAGSLDPLDDTNNSASDFILALPAPRNNARQNGTLPASTCGNNTLEGLEDCDDGDTQSGDGCSNLCYRESDTVAPAALAADPAAGAASDGNGVFEPGETAGLRASWRNTLSTPVDLAGAAALFTGPAGATYSILDGLARYGEIPAGATAGCTTDCFQLRLSTPGALPAARPATHWDTSIDEVVTGGGRTRRSVHIGDSFTDVPRSYLFYRRVETVLHHGITAGCSATQYCPNDKVRRDQMGLFLGRAIAKGGANIPQSGSVGLSPYNCTVGGVSLFSDVAPTDSTCKAIHYIASKNVTGGCGGGAYCVSQNVTRAEMGIFVARGIVQPGGGAAVPLTYGPDPVTGRSYSCNAASPNLNFTDITTADSFCKHVHYLWAKGIVSGCSATQYCVAGEVSRGEMARFLSNAFAPNLYGPAP
jgi:cysteine-rich repeat protein